MFGEIQMNQHQPGVELRLVDLAGLVAIAHAKGPLCQTLKGLCTSPEGRVLHLLQIVVRAADDVRTSAAISRLWRSHLAWLFGDRDTVGSLSNKKCLPLTDCFFGPVRRQ